jgi:hypothetical protein
MWVGKGEEGGDARAFILTEEALVEELEELFLDGFIAAKWFSNMFHGFSNGIFSPRLRRKMVK